MTLLLLAFMFVFRVVVPGLSAAPPEPQALVIEAPNLEQDMLGAMNAERAAHGLPALEWVEGFADVGRERAEYVIATGDFSHRSGDRVLFNEALLAHGYLWDNGGENIARVSGAADASVPTAMRMLMASPGHRDNILHPLWRYAGVGMAESGNTRVYTMIFIDVWANPDRR